MNDWHFGGIMGTETLQIIYKYAVILIYSFFCTYWALPYVMAKLKKYGYMVKDYYKKGKEKIPVMGGITMLIGILISLSLSVILLDRLEMGDLFIFYFVIVVYGLYGILDDLFNFRTRYDKIIVTMILTLPIASLIPDTTIHLFDFSIGLGAAYSLLFVPIFIMFVANSINLHAGYNGLSTGLELILLITIAIRSYMVNGIESLLVFLPVLGAVLAFYPSTFYPARALPGNVGDFLVGSAIGALMVTQNMTWFGAFILIPHIINFLMDSYTILLRRIPDVKFGGVDKDNHIVAPPSMKFKSLKFLIVSWFKLTEKQATLWLYAFTAMFCVIGLLVF